MLRNYLQRAKFRVENEEEKTEEENKIELEEDGFSLEVEESKEVCEEEFDSTSVAIDEGALKKVVFRIQDYPQTPEDLKVLILCPPKEYLKMHGAFTSIS